MTRRFAVALLIVLEASCTTRSDAHKWSGTIREVGGVEVVSNPREPLLGSSLSPGAPVWVTPSPAQGADSDNWQEPISIRATDTVVYVLDGMGNRVYEVRTQHGSRGGSFGSTGEGPGELQGPFGLEVVGDTVVVGNGGNASLEFFDGQGHYGRAVHLGRMGFAMHRFGTKDLLVYALLGAEASWDVVATATGAASPFAWPRWIQGGEHSCFQVASDANDVYRLDCRRLTYQVIDQRGQLLREVTVNRPAQAAPAAQVQVAVRHIEDVMAKSGRSTAEIERQVAQEKKRLQEMPVMRRLRKNRTTGQMAVWEQQPEELGPDSAIVDVFDRDGRYLESLQFHAPWVDFDWIGTRLYALQEDRRTGLVRLVAWDLDVPK